MIKKIYDIRSCTQTTGVGITTSLGGGGIAGTMRKDGYGIIKELEDSYRKLARDVLAMAITYQAVLLLQVHPLPGDIQQNRGIRGPNIFHFLADRAQ